MATGVAGAMALQGARQALAGQRPGLSELLLSPGNARRITHHLGELRGAAMKLGQLLSMEAGDFLAPELTEILGRLRADAPFMPPHQLKKVLIENWGADFLKRFETFEVRPIAAASIGQVHRARTKDGRDLAIKVQYPGVRESIDSDVDNVASLIRLSGLLPADLDIAPLLAEAKRQLHEEADYVREGRYLARFGALLADDAAYAVPALQPDLTTPTILAMTHLKGAPVESLATASQEAACQEAACQEARDRVVRLLLELVLRELFAFGVMQTDPNFANYRNDAETGRLVLLDFGAARDVPPETSEACRQLLRAALAGERAPIREAALALGLFDASTAERHQEAVLDMIDLASAPLRSGGVFDFGDRALTARLREAGMALATAEDFWHIPPIDTLFVQRKCAGVYLLAARLRAKVDSSRLLAPYV